MQRHALHSHCSVWCWLASTHPDLTGAQRIVRSSSARGRDSALACVERPCRTQSTDTTSRGTPTGPRARTTQACDSWHGPNSHADSTHPLSKHPAPSRLKTHTTIGSTKAEAPGDNRRPRRQGRQAAHMRHAPCVRAGRQRPCAMCARTRLHTRASTRTCTRSTTTPTPQTSKRTEPAPTAATHRTVTRNLTRQSQGARRPPCQASARRPALCSRML